MDVFKKVKKSRGKTNIVSTSVDGFTGPENISNYFADIYSELYQ